MDFDDSAPPGADDNYVSLGSQLFGKAQPPEEFIASPNDADSFLPTWHPLATGTINDHPVEISRERLAACLRTGYRLGRMLVETGHVMADGTFSSGPYAVQQALKDTAEVKGWAREYELVHKPILDSIRFLQKRLRSKFNEEDARNILANIVDDGYGTFSYLYMLAPVENYGIAILNHSALLRKYSRISRLPNESKQIRGIIEAYGDQSNSVRELLKFIDALMVLLNTNPYDYRTKSSLGKRLAKIIGSPSL